MSDKYSNIKRIIYKGKFFRLAELLKSGFHSDFEGASPEMAKLAAVRSQLGDQQWPEELTEQGRAVVSVMEAALRQGYADYEIEKKKREDKELKEAKAREDKKQQFITVYRETELPESIAVPIDRLVDESVAAALGEDFLFEEGVFKIREGKKPLPAYGAGFKNLNELHGKALNLKEGFANYEAKLALAAKLSMGNDWVLALSDATRADVTRIRKNVLAIQRFRALGFDDTGVPIGTLRALTEIRLHPNDAKNNKLLKEGITKFFDDSKSRGGWINQHEAKEMLTRLANKAKSGYQQIWDTFYHIGDKVFGSIGLDDELFDKADRVVDRKTGCVILRKDGEYVYEAIPPYVGLAAEEAIKKQDEPEHVADIVIPQRESEPSLDDLFNSEMGDDDL